MHVTCHFDRGDWLRVGAGLCIEEYLHGRLHRLHLRATEVIPNRLMRYRDHALTGAFVLEPADGGTRFTAELAFGIRAPVIESVLDAIARRLLARRLAALQIHMREEGDNLKRLIKREHAT